MGITIPNRTLKSGHEMPVYGLGTWGMGGLTNANTAEDTRWVRAIEESLAAGVTHIDTAEMYGAGHTEELVGRAIRGATRAKLFITSKVLAHNLTSSAMARAVDGSLGRLGTDYLDLYLVHHPTDQIAIEEILDGLAGLVRDGRVRAVGVSNFTKDRLERARNRAIEPIVVNQVHYSLAVREPERSGLVNYCRSNEVVLTAWQPLDQKGCADSKTVAELCRKYECTTAQIALNWLLSQAVTVVSRTTSLAHLNDNLEALTWRMEEADIELLRSGYEHQKERSEVYALG